MMKATNISAGAAASGYYKTEGYYSLENDEGTKSAEWFGSAAKELGLIGNVDDDLFARMLDGETFEKGQDGLVEGRVMGRWENGERKHRAGIDLTFSAPKDVSIAALVLKDERVVEAHKAAVVATMEIVEKELVQTRRVQDGKMMKETGGKIIAGLFLHDTSRALDPQLHTHAAIANMVRNEDGSYTALTNDQIMKAVTFGSEVYRSFLAQALEKIGYTVEREGQHRLISLREIPQALSDLFSKRSKEIDEAIAKYGVENVPQNRELAAMATRVKKDKNIDRDKLDQEWKTEAEKAGIDLSALTKAVEVTRERSTTRVPPEQQAEKTSELAQLAVAKSIAHVSETATIYTKADLLKAATTFADDKLSPNDVLAALNSAIDSKQLYRASDYSAHGKVSEQFFTDEKSLFTERSIVNAYRLTQSAAMLPSKVEGRSLEGALSQSLRFSSLTDGQKEAITNSLSGRSLIVGVQGYAGTGKTYMLSKLVKEANKLGFDVEGLAPSNKARALLEEAVPNTETLQARLTRGRAPEGSSKPEKTILVVDEASFVSNKDMLAFIRLSREQKYARVVLLGDVKQLDGVGAGTPFDLLQKVGMPTATMIDIVRTRDDNLLSAVHHAIAGEVKQAFEKIGSNIVVPEDKDYAKAAADIFLASPAEKRAVSTITTPSNDVRRAINDHVRQGLRSDGTIETEEKTLNVLIAERLSKVQAQERHSYRDGDVIVSRQSIKAAGLSKGGIYDVSISEDYSTLALTSRKTGETVSFEPWKSDRVANAIDLYREEQQAFSVGDRVKFGIADKKNGIVNGDTGVIRGMSEDQIQIEHSNGKTIALRHETLALKGMDYSYSLTAHGIQGDSVKHIIVAMGSREYLADQKGFYVGISRGVNSATLVTDDAQRLAERLQIQTGEKIGALEAFGTALLELEKQRKSMAEKELEASKAPPEEKTIAEEKATNTRDETPAKSQPEDQKTEEKSAEKTSEKHQESIAEIRKLMQDVKDLAEQKEIGERQ